MADTDSQDQATATPAPATTDPDLITKYLALLNQGPPNIQPDQTPVDDSGFWGGYRHVVGILGEALGGGRGTPGDAALSPAERQAAGAKALGDFGTSLMAASRYQPGQTIFSNLASGFQGAERSYRGTEQDAAGMLAARQAYAADQQANQLARIKEALPLLTLQGQIQRAQAAAKLAGGGGQTPGGGGSIATGGSLTPFVASNLPDGVSPAEDQMVRTVIGEAANQGTVGQQAVAAVIKNRMDAGKQGAQDVIFAPNQFEPWNNPKTRATLEAIDPNSKQYQDILNNAVRPVMAGTAKDPTGGATHFYSPTAQKALGRDAPDWAQGQTPTVIGQHNFYKLPYSPQAPAPGQTAAATPPPPNAAPPPAPQPGQIVPPAPVGQNPGAKVPIPPPVVPPVAPPVQTAGPGAGNAPVMPPDFTQPPAGAVVRPAEGAPDQTTPPAQPPAAQPPQFPDINVAGVTFKHPGDANAYQAQQYAPPPATEDLNPNLSPQTLAGFAVRRQALQLLQQQAQGLNPVDVPKALMDVKTKQADLEAEAQNAAQAKAQSAAEKLSTYNAAQRKEIQTRYDNQITQYTGAATAQQASANKIAEINAQSSAQTQSKALEDINKSTGAATTIGNQVQLALQLSKNAGDPSLLTMLPGLTNGLISTQMLSPDTVKQIGAQRAMDSTINTMIGSLRQQEGMSRMTDADLKFLTNTAGSSFTPEQIRLPMLAAIQTAAQRQQKFGHLVNALHTQGMTVDAAEEAADTKLGHITPVVPTAFPNVSVNDAEGIKKMQDAWIRDEVAPGSFYMKPKPDGTHVLSIRPVQ